MQGEPRQAGRFSRFRPDHQLERQAITSLQPWTTLHTQKPKPFGHADVDALFERHKQECMRLKIDKGELSVTLPIDTWAHGRAHTVQRMFESVHKSRGLPEGLDVVWNIDDRPLSPASFESFHALPPLFGNCAQQGFADVPGTPIELDWANAEEASLLESISWQNRSEVAWWRGSTTGRWLISGGHRTLDNWAELPRSKLCNISKQHPDFLDASYVACAKCEPGVWEAIVEVLGAPDPAGYPTVEGQAQHKYLIDIDGEGFSSRFALHLGMGVVYFKVETEYPTMLTEVALPYVHYMPVKADMSDLISQIVYAREHDTEMQRMAAAARDLFVELKSTGWQHHLHVQMQTYHTLFLP